MRTRVANFAKSAARALDVMIFLQTSGPTRASQIADSLGIARSSADQLLKTLVETEYLTFSLTTKCYFPSPRLASFGQWLTHVFQGSAWMSSLLDDVQRSTGELVTLTCENGWHMDLLEARFANVGPDFEGKFKSTKIPVVGSVAGTASLATRPDCEIQRLVRSAKSRKTAQNTVTSEEITQIVDHVRQFGYALSVRDNRASEWVGQPRRSLAMAVPINNANLRLVLGMNGPGASIDAHKNDYARLMREAVARHAPAALR